MKLALRALLLALALLAFLRPIPAVYDTAPPAAWALLSLINLPLAVTAARDLLRVRFAPGLERLFAGIVVLLALGDVASPEAWQALPPIVQSLQAFPALLLALDDLRPPPRPRTPPTTP